MERDINQKFIKISGRSEILAQHEIGEDITLFLKGSIVKTEVKDNQDGSVDITYVVKALDLEEVNK